MLSRGSQISQRAFSHDAFDVNGCNQEMKFFTGACVVTVRTCNMELSISVTGAFRHDLCAASQTLPPASVRVVPSYKGLEEFDSINIPVVHTKLQDHIDTTYSDQTSLRS